MDPNKATRKVTFEPCAMLVGLEEREVELCTEICRPISVLRVGHVTAAIERMIVTRPRIVIYTREMGEGEKMRLRERAQDVGAKLLEIADGVNEAEIAPKIHAAFAL